jgi:hypothetical protein
MVIDIGDKLLISYEEYGNVSVLRMDKNKMKISDILDNNIIGFNSNEIEELDGLINTTNLGTLQYKGH